MPHKINNTTGSKVRAQGNGILVQMESFNFTVSLEVMSPILHLILKTSKNLQSPTKNLCEATNDGDSLLNAWNNIFTFDEVKYFTFFSCIRLHPIQEFRATVFSRNKTHYHPCG